MPRLFHAQSAQGCHAAQLPMTKLGAECLSPEALGGDVHINVDAMPRHSCLGKHLCENVASLASAWHIEVS